MYSDVHGSKFLYTVFMVDCELEIIGKRIHKVGRRERLMRRLQGIMRGMEGEKSINL